MEQDKLTFIKKDAKIPVVIGAGFMQKLQQALIFLIEEKTAEEIEAFEAALRDQKTLEGWMLHYETLALLVKGIEDSAAENNMTEEQGLLTP